MYSDNQGKLPQQEIEVTIRNLPNDAKNEEIIEYLQMAGPIKTSKFVREQQRYSAIVVYYDNESAQQCRKYLADRYFKGRALTITAQVKKNFNIQNNNPAQICSPDDDLYKQISSLKREERKMLFGLLKNLKSDGKIFEMFLESRPKLVETLLSRAFLD